MGRRKENAALDEATVRAMLGDEATFAEHLRVAARDNRAAWIYQNNLGVVETVRRAAPWLRGACETVPDQMISEVLRPGMDGDLRATHQRLAYARTAVERGSVDTPAFVFMKVSDYLVVEALESLGENDLTREARRLLDANYAYQERACRKGHAQEIVCKTMTEKALAYGDVMQRLADRFGALERARIGTWEPLSAEDSAVLRKLDDLAEDMAAMRRATKTPPASSRTQAWVMARWRFYNDHPEALKGAQERKRVYVRDVWDSDREAAQNEHAIASLRDFRHILRAAQQSELRRTREDG